MRVVKERVASYEHEEEPMHVDDRLLHPDRTDAEDISLEDDDELDQHHENGKPGNGASDTLVEGVDQAGDAGECGHGSEPRQPRRASTKPSSPMRVHSFVVSRKVRKLS